MYTRPVKQRPTHLSPFADWLYFWKSGRHTFSGSSIPSFSLMKRHKLCRFAKADGTTDVQKSNEIAAFCYGGVSSMCDIGTNNYHPVTLRTTVT